jgi:serine/threonine protein phosphatase PrpC
MDTEDTDHRAADLLEQLRNAVPGKPAWPEGEAYERLLAQARELISQTGEVLGDGQPMPSDQSQASHQPPPDPDEAPSEQSAPEPVDAPPAPPAQPPTDADQLPEPEAVLEPADSVADSAPPPDDAPTLSLRPGEIPPETLPPAASAPPRLCVEIERNATEGAPYRSAVAAYADTGASVSVVGCEIPADAGVSFEVDHLVGDNPRAGDYPLRFTCILDEDATLPNLVAEALLVVNPNPRTLWKDLESDRDAPGWKPDQACESVTGASGTRIVAASQRGRSHAHRGGFRDDDFAIYVTGPDGWNLVAVADGAGSAERSRIGSRVAAQMAVSVAATKLGETASLWPITAMEANPQDLAGARTAAYQVLGAAAFEALKAIEAKAKDQGFPPRAYATTLLLTAHRRIASGDLVAAYWVGDGAIALFAADSDVTIMGTPDGGEYAGQTRFLERDVMSDGNEIMSRLEVKVVPRFDALILMTDGVSDPKFPSDLALRNTQEWKRLWAELVPILDAPDAAQQLTDWLGFWDVGNHDDRTIAVIR